ncbi:Putative aminoacrylate hydrolase RutD [Usitatibacter rugosus]|uniref:Aminoacrylate hydrolase RutD n=1 Tax=Usitatibacter rugosus TaxID=2732067 RepID=A0A6M4GSR1_9PROT|nr:alpha/beta fold hydrolase [Usitatibacter rugosus]QJR10132.1 Putative aminoacrylate hydrolase RutD [Usitatibacter rugosus]
MPPTAPPPIHFCASADGTRLAYTVTGKGTPLVKAPHWLTHLEYEYQSPLWRPWIDGLSRGHRLLRMDARACGLSDADVKDVSFEASVRDLEAVVDAAGYNTFALMGHSQGAAIAIEYAARHPDRVTALVILGGYARGVLKRGLPPERVSEFEALVQLIEAGWGREDGSYRTMFAMQFAPGATPEQIASLSDLQRVSCSAVNAARLVRSYYMIDATPSAPLVRCPTLVMHQRGDRRVPFEEGRVIAGLIPGAQFLPLESDNHVLLPQEPAYAEFFEALEAFVPRAAGDETTDAFPSLTPREAGILDCIARGLDNAQIATQLGISGKTVRNNITSIFDKLGVENRAKAIVLAREHGMGGA